MGGVRVGRSASADVVDTGVDALALGVGVEVLGLYSLAFRFQVKALALGFKEDFFVGSGVVADEVLEEAPLSIELVF